MNMSSDHLENLSKTPTRDSDRFLVLLKTRGRQTSSELAAALGITHEAARQQLVKLAKDGFIEAESAASGVGRPAQFWRLTSLGQSRFPDSHADLTAQLIRTIRAELGEDALEKVIGAREQETRSNYSAELLQAKTLEDRVAKLAAIRTREGYMAEWRADDEGLLLVENHCPICAAVSVCQGFCRSELAIFQDVLGEGATVERVEHIPHGARRCAYRIQAARPPIAE